MMSRGKQRGLVLLVDQYSYAPGNALAAFNWDDVVFASSAEQVSVFEEESRYGWGVFQGGVNVINTRSKFAAKSLVGTLGASVFSRNIHHPARLLGMQTTNATLALWIRPLNFGTSMTLICQRDPNTAKGWALGTNTSAGLFFTTDATSITTAASVLTINTWYHVMVVKSGSSFYLFLNGVLAASGTGTITLSTANGSNGDAIFHLFGSSTLVDYIGYADDIVLIENLKDASSSGVVTLNIKKNGTTIFSTNLSIDASEKTSVTAATPAVLSVSPTAVADDDEFTFDITAAGTAAKGLAAELIGTMP